MSLNHPCPLLRKIYDMLLDEWYEDQHFDSPVFDQLRQIERECGATLKINTVKDYENRT